MLSLPAANGPCGPSDRDAPPISHARISALGVEHDDLDSAIDALIKANTLDGLIIARLKKRKLKIRDEIAGLVAAATGMAAPAAKEVVHG